MFKNLNQQWAHQLAVYKASHGIDPKEKREQTSESLGRGLAPLNTRSLVQHPHYTAYTKSFML